MHFIFLLPKAGFSLVEDNFDRSREKKVRFNENCTQPFFTKKVLNSGLVIKGLFLRWNIFC